MKKRSPGVAAAIAVTLSQTGTTGGNLKGKVWVIALPQFSLFIFKYLLLKTKVLYAFKDKVNSKSLKTLANEFAARYAYSI